VSPDCPVSMSGITEEVILKRVQHYEQISQVALSLMVTGCYWGTQAHQKLWADLLQRVANPGGDRSGNTTLLDLRRYPALLLLNGGGLAAVAAEHYDTLLTLLTRPKIVHERYEQDQPPLYLLAPYRVVDKDLFNKITGQQLYAPLSEHFFKL